MTNSFFTYYHVSVFALLTATIVTRRGKQILLTELFSLPLVFPYAPSPDGLEDGCYKHMCVIAYYKDLIAQPEIAYYFLFGFG